jgi:DUF177 domain-containing protein
MILRVGRLGGESASQEADVVLAIQDAAGEEEEQRLHVRCTFEGVGERVRVAGTIRGQAQSHCHRCLAEFERAVEAHFTVLLQRGGESDADDVVVIPESADEVDITAFVREAVILEEPIRALCRTDCRGLCSQCGQDRNVATCDCVPPADPRWDALKRLTEQREP